MGEEVIAARIFYGDELIAQVPENKTAKLMCHHNLAAEDIVVEFEGSGRIIYNNTTSTVDEWSIATLHCKGSIFKSDVIVSVGRTPSYRLVNNNYGGQTALLHRFGQENNTTGISVVITD